MTHSRGNTSQGWIQWGLSSTNSLLDKATSSLYRGSNVLHSVSGRVSGSRRWYDLRRVPAYGLEFASWALFGCSFVSWTFSSSLRTGEYLVRHRRQILNTPANAVADAAIALTASYPSLQRQIRPIAPIAIQTAAYLLRHRGQFLDNPASATANALTAVSAPYPLIEPHVRRLAPIVTGTLVEYIERPESALDRMLGKIRDQYPALAPFMSHAAEGISHVGEHKEAYLDDPVKTAYDALTSRAPEIHPNDFYTEMAAQTAFLSENIDTWLKEVMDDEAHAEMRRRRDEMLAQAHDYLPCFEQDPLFYYCNLSLVAEQVTTFLPICGQTLSDFQTALDEDKRVIDRLNALLNLLALIKPIKKHFFDSLKPTYERLRLKDNLPLRIPGLADVTAIMEKFLPVERFLDNLDSDRIKMVFDHLFSKESSLAEQYQQNPEIYFEDLFKKIKLSWHPGDPANNRLTSLNRPSSPPLPDFEDEERPETVFLPDIHEGPDLFIPPAHASEDPLARQADTVAILAELLKKQLDEIKDDRITESARKDIEKAMNALLRLKDTFSWFGGTSKSILKMVFFVYKSAWDALQLLIHGSQAYNSLASTFHDDYLNILHELNLLFAETCKKLDRIELQGFMKEGWLLRLPVGENGPSVYSIMELLTSQIGKEAGLLSNYAFHESERFPYPVSQHAARNTLLERAREDNTFTRHFLAKRAADSQSALDAFRQAIRKEKADKNRDYLGARDALIVSSLTPSIERLEEELEHWWLDTKRRRTKLDLLKSLRFHLLEEHLAFDEALAKIKSARPGECHLLWEGRTRSVLSRLKTVCLLPKDCMSPLNIAISRLEGERTHQAFLFKGQAGVMLETRIAALKTLKELLAIPGYRPSSALKKLSARNPALYETLKTHDKATLVAIKNIESTLDKTYGRKIAGSQFGKILIGHDRPPAKAPDRHLPEAKMQRLQQAITDLELERRHFFLSEATRAKKIALLSLVRNMLRASRHSLKTVLEDLAMHNRYAVREMRPGTELQKGILYFSFVDGLEKALRYTVINPYGKKVEGLLTATDLPALAREIRPRLDLRHLEKLLPAILEITAQRATYDPENEIPMQHTYPASLATSLYLLHEGRTGKIIQEISAECLSREETLEKIQIEIERLSAKRPEWLLLFPARRKQRLEENISLLESLKSAMTLEDNIDAALGALAPQEQERLTRDFRLLLTSLGATLPSRERGCFFPAAALP